MAMQNRMRRIDELIQEDRTRIAMATKAINTIYLGHEKRYGNGRRNYHNMEVKKNINPILGGLEKQRVQKDELLEEVSIVGIPATVKICGGQRPSLSKEDTIVSANENDKLEEVAQLARRSMEKRECKRECVPSSSLLMSGYCTISLHGTDKVYQNEKKKQEVKEKQVFKKMLEMKERCNLFKSHKANCRTQVDKSVSERYKNTAVKHMDIIRKTDNGRDLIMKRNKLTRVQSSESKEDKELSHMFGKKIMLLKRTPLN